MVGLATGDGMGDAATLGAFGIGSFSIGFIAFFLGFGAVLRRDGAFVIMFFFIFFGGRGF